MKSRLTGAAAILLALAGCSAASEAESAPDAEGRSATAKSTSLPPFGEPGSPELKMQHPVAVD